MSKYEVRNCKRHGDVSFVLESRGSYRCTKCRSYQVQKRRDKIKQMAFEYKGGKCERCKYDKCLAAMDFHHLDPTQKDFNLGEKGYTRSWGKVKKELDKCILVCCRCHREIHDEEVKNSKIDYGIKEKVKKEIVLNNCPICDKLKNSEMTTCSPECANKKRRKINWDEVDLETLYKEHSMVAIGKMYGVSDNAVRKHLKNKNIIPR